MDRLRVGTLDLRIAAPEALRPVADDLRADLEKRFVPAVLEVARRQLRTQFGPDAVIRIGRLDLRFNLGPAQLALPETVEAFGRDLAGTIAALALRIDLTSPPATQPRDTRAFSPTRWISSRHVFWPP